MSNLRLLSYKSLEVKDIPFDKDGLASDYSILLPIEFCKKIAEFKLTAHYTRSVPLEFIFKSLEEGTGYFLDMRLLFSKHFALNHDKELDKTNI